MIGLFLAAVAALVVPLVSGFVRADEPLGIVLWFAGVVLCAVLLCFTFYSRDALPALVHLPDWCQEILVLSDPSPQRRFRRLPWRKRQRLRAAALRTGPEPDFPLLRQQVEQLGATARIADRVRAAASTYRFVLWIVLIDWLLLACATGLAPESLDRMAGQAKSALSILVVSSAVHLGIAALNGLAYAGTKRRMFWVPVALGALSGGLAGLAALVAVGAFLSYRPDAQTIFFVALAVALFLALVCLLSFRAAAAIVRFHAQPEWCRQVITAVD